ncbi:MAG: hypothetical protein FWG22_02020 [Prolixibacteraceae bacterium]|nr:hypothetical protein [Prolixibacteraceae bacterium]
MKVFKNVISFVVLIPFLVSVSGLLLVQTHCNCTGKTATSLFAPPEGCSSLHDDHMHLFECHAENLAHAGCTSHNNCEHNDDCTHDSESHNCGCESPEAKFLKNSSQFTQGKIFQLDIFTMKKLSVPDISISKPETAKTLAFQYLFENSPPLPSESQDFIYFICQPKRPHAACFFV